MLGRDGRTRVVAYVRSAQGEADSVAFWQSPECVQQTRAIEAWASAHGGAVTATAVERTPSGFERIGERVAFVSALTQVHDGIADVVCLATLGSLDDDLVVQELLLAEARGSHVAIASAEPADEALLAEHPSDPRRALVRRVIQEFPEFQGEMRTLRAWVRRMQIADGMESVGPALAALESIQEHGEDARAGSMLARFKSPAHRIARHLRSRRVARER